MILRDGDARNRWRWAPYFEPGEFVCSHCRELAIDTEFMDTLWRVRLEYGRPMVVTSGYRCPVHNAAVSSTGTSGPHTTGAAADIGVSGADAFDLVAFALRFGVRGLGIHQAGAHARRFVHVDTLDGQRHPRPRVWSYPRA